jgi:2-oxoisovalerate dehydrogenase E1 component beta subunit
MLGRMRGHSEGDDSLKVVPPEELDAYKAADPVPAYARRLSRDGILDFETDHRIGRRVEHLVESSLRRALEAETPRPANARRPALAPASPAPEPDRRGGGEPVTYVEAIHQALVEEMEADDRLLLMGQDIGVFEGAFRVTRGLHERWPQRVLDTPIAESGTVGIAVGAALGGHPSVVEMQFADFVTCGFNQIVNVAAKLYYRWQVPCPIVIRLPSGGGVGAGPFHSQNPEGWFAHVAGLEVVCPATAIDAKGLLKAAIRSPNPVIFCEHKFLYRRVKEVLPSGDLVVPIGRARVARPGREVSVVAYGATVWAALEVAERLAGEGIEVEVVDLRTLVPLDEETVLGSARRTGRVVVAHEAQATGGFGGEIVARIASEAFEWLDAPVRRVAYPDRPVPYAKVLERELLPDDEKLERVVRELVRY